MSYFGDTPHQELYEAIQSFQEKHHLSKEELLAVLIRVLQAIFDPYEEISERIRKS